jgi:hypothetical protein
MQEEIYSIVNLNNYAKEIRRLAAACLAESSNDNLDEYISINQLINLIKENCIGFDNKNHLLLNETINKKIFEETVVWIHNVGLAKLAGKNLIQCAWDDELNEIIFWTD